MHMRNTNGKRGGDTCHRAHELQSISTFQIWRGTPAQCKSFNHTCMHCANTHHPIVHTKTFEQTSPCCRMHIPHTVTSMQYELHPLHCSRWPHEIVSHPHSERSLVIMKRKSAPKTPRMRSRITENAALQEHIFSLLT